MKKIILVTGISLLLIFFYADSISAYDDVEAITVSPVVYEIDTTCGEEIYLEAELRNNTNEKLYIDISFENINLESLVNEDRLVIKEGESSQKPAVWLSSEDTDYEIEPNSVKEFLFKLSIPSDAEIKSYYPVILYKTKFSGQEETTVEVTDIISSLIYLNVSDSGDKSMSSLARINEFNVHKKIIFSTEAVFNLILENTGNTFIHPRGSIHIYDRNGMLLSDTLTVNDKYVYLIQGQKLEERIPWSRKSNFKLIPDFGKYTAVAEIYHNSDKTAVSQAETYFYIVPLKHIAIIIGVFALILAGISLFRILKRRYL